MPQNSFQNRALGGMLTPNVRELIARAKRQGLQGDLTGAMETLAQGRSQLLPENIALDLTRAELLYLDQRTDEALVILDQDVLPKLHKLPDEVAITIEKNRVL